MRLDQLRAQRFAVLLSLGTRLRDAAEDGDAVTIAPEDAVELAAAIDDCLRTRARLNALLESERAEAAPRRPARTASWQRAIERSNAA